MNRKYFSISLILVVLAILPIVIFTNLRSNTKNIDDIDASALKVFLINKQDFENGTKGEESKLLFTGKDINEYNWEKHEIIFKPEFLKKRNINFSRDNNEKLNSKGSKVLGAKFTERFVFYLNEEKIYEGYFQQPMYSSYYPIGAVIEDIENGIKINWNSIDDCIDVRNDDRILNFLKEKKLY